jgi:hypothetical protein
MSVPFLWMLQCRLIFKEILYMNLPVSIKNTEQLNFHFLLEEDAGGQIVGTIAELPGCQVTAKTQEEAIDALQQMTRDRMAKITVVPFSINVNVEEVEQKENPWLKFMGMYRTHLTSLRDLI